MCCSNSSIPSGSFDQLLFLAFSTVLHEESEMSPPSMVVVGTPGAHLRHTGDNMSLLVMRESPGATFVGKGFSSLRMRAKPNPRGEPRRHST